MLGSFYSLLVQKLSLPESKINKQIISNIFNSILLSLASSYTTHGELMAYWDTETTPWVLFPFP
jgi:hypothetical protein